MFLSIFDYPLQSCCLFWHINFILVIRVFDSSFNVSLQNMIERLVEMGQEPPKEPQPETPIR